MSKINHTAHNKEAEQRIKANVEKYGWHVALFEEAETEPTFAYSIGLWKTFSHPEIIVFGLPLNSMHTILNIAGDKIKDGHKLDVHKDDFDFLEKYPVQFLPVDKEYFKEYFGYCMWFNNYDQFPALQLVWPDSNGIFPWHKEFDKKLAGKQPILNKEIENKS